MLFCYYSNALSLTLFRRNQLHKGIPCNYTMIPSADTTWLSSFFIAKLLLNGCDCFICDFKQAGTAKLCRRDQGVEVQGLI